MTQIREDLKIPSPPHHHVFSTCHLLNTAIENTTSAHNVYIYIYIMHIMYISADPSHLQGERAREKVALFCRIAVAADPSHLQGERAREKVALSILPHSGSSSLASNASRRLRRRLLLHSGSSVKCPAAPLPEAFAAFWTLSKSFSSGFRKQR